MTTTEDVIYELIRRVTALEEQGDNNEAHDGEFEGFTVVDSIDQVQDPYPNQLVVVTGDTSGPAGGRMFRYAGQASGFVPLN